MASLMLQSYKLFYSLSRLQLHVGVVNIRHNFANFFMQPTVQQQVQNDI